MLSFKPAFSFSSFTLVKRFLAPLCFPPLKWSSQNMRLLIFLLTILLLSCDSSSPAFHLMYPAYKLNKQGDYIQPLCTPFPIWNQSVVPCLVLSVACCSAAFGLLETKFVSSHYLQNSVQFSSVAQSCPTLCDLMNRSTPGLPVHHQLPEFIQIHVH